MMNLTFKQHKQIGQQFAEYAAELIQAKTQEGGFMNLQQVELDWNGKQTAVITLLWDLTSAIQGFVGVDVDNAETIELTEQAEAVAESAQTGIEMLQYCIQDVVDGFYDRTNELSIYTEVVEAVRAELETGDGTCADEVAILAEIAVIGAKGVANALEHSGFTAEAAKMKEFRGFIRQFAQAANIIESKVNDSSEVEAEVEAPAEVDLKADFAAKFSAGMGNEAPSAINDLDAIFQGL